MSEAIRMWMEISFNIAYLIVIWWFVIAMFRKKHAYMIIFALATLLTFAKVGWMIIAYSTIIKMLRKKIPEMYLLLIGITMLIMFFGVIWYDIIPSGAAIHLVGFIKIITNLDSHIIGQGLGHGGTWSLSLRHLKEYIRLGAGSESGIGTLIAELGVIGCVVYFLTLYKLADMKHMDAAAWSVALLIFSIMVLQENYASPIPAFVVVWMLFEIKEQPGLSKGAIKPSMYFKNISWTNLKLPSFGFR